MTERPGQNEAPLLLVFSLTGAPSGRNRAKRLCLLALEAHGAEIIDVRSIVPLDEELIYRSVRKTSRVVVAHEDTFTMGFGGEVATRIAQNCFEHVDAPVVRVAAKDSFVPSASNLELMVLPSVEDLRRGVEQVLNY